jgi:hypothetical protein
MQGKSRKREREREKEKENGEKVVLHAEPG